jgi:hypothetical protein
MVRLLLVDVTEQRADIRWANRKQTIATLPREVINPLLLHPNGGARFDLRNNLGRRSRRRQSQRKMDVVGNSTDPEAFAIQLACGPRKIGMQCRFDSIVDQRGTMFRAEDDMHQIETQGLRHGSDYMSGLQPLLGAGNVYLGLRPRLVCRRTFGPQFIGQYSSMAFAMDTCQTRDHKFVGEPSSLASLVQAPKARQHTSLGRRPR